MHGRELYVSGTAQLHYVYPAVKLWALIMQRVSLLSATETHSGLARVAHSQGQRGTGLPASKWRVWTPHFCLFLFSCVCDVTSGVCFDAPVCLFIYLDRVRLTSIKHILEWRIGETINELRYFHILKLQI